MNDSPSIPLIKNTPLEIYHFFSNRNLLQFPRSIETIDGDITEEFHRDSNHVISGYTRMKKQLSIITNEVCVEECQELYDNAPTFKNFMKLIMDNKINEYQILSNNRQVVLKNLYRITVPNFIFTFMTMHKGILPNKTIERILPLITNIVYLKDNKMLNLYIKKSLAMKLLMEIDKKNFKDYYNYCRFKYLYDKLLELKLAPKLYNSNNGALYFTISYSQSSQKEQIFERLRLNNNSALIKIDEVQLYINSNIGEVSRIRKLFDKRWKKFHTDISDNMSYNAPNIIRKIIHNIINNFSKKTYKYSYKEILAYLFKNNIRVEDYCEKVDDDGVLLRVPIQHEWKLMTAKDVRVLTINNIDIKLLLESYDMVLKPILHVIMKGG